MMRPLSVYIYILCVPDNNKVVTLNHNTTSTLLVDIHALSPVGIVIQYPLYINICLSVLASDILCLFYSIQFIPKPDSWPVKNTRQHMEQDKLN